MVTKATKKKGSRVKVGKLKVNKETVKNLTKSEVKKIKGGGTACPTTVLHVTR
jgi:hypothetical protein